MKENYDTEQEIAIVEFAQRWNITPELVRRYLDQVQDSQFTDSLDLIDDMLWEKNYKYIEYDRDWRAEYEANL